MMTEWKYLRQLIDQKGLYPQYLENAENYFIRLIENNITLGECVLNKTMNAQEVEEFESLYKTNSNKPLTITYSPFAAKTFGSKKLYARNTGMQQALSIGSNVITHTIGYPWVKLIGAEIVNGTPLDYIDFEVYDTAGGTYSGVPNAKLNQFGFTINVSPGYYCREVPYDADLYAGMILKMTYNSVSEKTIGVNLIMNEVKS